MQRKPIGMPAMPAGFSMSPCGRYMMNPNKMSMSAARRYMLAMKTATLIASDRTVAASFAVHQPDGIYWVRKDGA